MITAREVTVGTSRGQQMGAMSKLTDTPLPGNLGGRSGCNRDIGVALNIDICGGGSSRPGGINKDTETG